MTSDSSLSPKEVEQQQYVADIRAVLGGNSKDELKVRELLSGSQEYTHEEERKLLRKIDAHMLILMAFTYGLQFLDKQALSYSAIMGLIEDTNLHGSQYSLLTTVFYIGLLVGEYPINASLQRFPTGKVTSILVFLWGASLAGMAGATNFGGLAAGRVFLGFFEAVVGPAMMLFTASWYRRKEQPLRTGAWYSFQGLAISLGGLLSYGVQKWGGPLTAWQNLFLFCGLLTSGWGIFLFFVLPDHIVSTPWLNDREKKIALLRLREEKMGVGNRIWKWSQVRETFSDPKVYLIVLFCFAANWVTSMNAFAALIIRGFGFSSLHTTLLNMPAGAFNVFTILTLSALCSKIKNIRCLCMAICYLFSTVGVIMVWKVDHSMPYTRLAGVWLSAMGPAGFTLCLSVATSNVTGQTKRVVTNASVFIAFAVGNMVSPQLFLDSQKPAYTTGIIGILVANVCAIFLAGFLALYMHLQNCKRDKDAQENSDADPDKNHDEGIKDMTDLENLHFRYVL